MLRSPAAWLQLLSSRRFVACTATAKKMFRANGLGFSLGFSAHIGFGVNAVVAFATFLPLGQQTEPEALEVT